MLILVILYGVLALLREVCAVRYYRAVLEVSAISASGHGLVIELLDSVAIVVVFERIIAGWGVKAIVPLIVYAICGAVGTYLSVKRIKK